MSMDLSDIVLILGSFTGTTGILELSQNKEYEVSPPEIHTGTTGNWWGKQSGEKPSGPFLCLSFDKLPYSPDGWVAGSDAATDVCDLQLVGDNTTGISRRHLKIDIASKSNRPRITLLSNRLMNVTVSGTRKAYRMRQEVKIGNAADINLGAISFRAWRPELTVNEDRLYQQKAQDFSRNLLASLPRYFPSLKTQLETNSSNVRYGREDAVYIRKQGVGAGSSASVMMVQESKTGKIYGAKEPHYRIFDDVGTARYRLEELRKEYENIMLLEHPNIVKAFDLVLAENENEPPWLIMEYIPLCLCPKEVAIHDVPIILTQVCSALAHMHSQNITHRDVKPDNILMENQDCLTAKLADFGSAKHNVTDQMDTFVGTCVYMAPEFYQSRRCYSYKVDMFSLGLIGVECFTTWDPSSDETWTSRPPLASKDHARWMRKKIIPHLAEAPDVFQDLLKGLLRRNARERWSASKSLVRLWEIAHPNANIGREQNVISGNNDQSDNTSQDSTEVAPTEAEDDGKTQRDAGNNKRRRGSTISSDDVSTGELQRRSLRKREPSTVAGNIAASLPPTQRPQQACTNSDPLSPSGVLPPSSAPTPFFDEDEFAPDNEEDDLGFVEASSGQFETEWAGSDDDSDNNSNIYHGNNRTYGSDDDDWV